MILDAIFHYKVAGVDHTIKIKPFWARFLKTLIFSAPHVPPPGGAGGTCTSEAAR